MSGIVLDGGRTIDAVIGVVQKAAEESRADAGRAGSWDDFGAARLEEQVKFYRYGQSGIIPPEWEQYRAKLDPEWDEYQRLRAKFGGQ